MYFLGKAFKVRGKIHGDEEKPFLAHLEDLRSMITKIVITLLISTVLCWVFHKQLIQVMSKPVHEVWEARQQEKLPESMGVSIDQWEELKQIQAVATQLAPGEQRRSYYDSFGREAMQLHAESASFYIAAMKIPDEEARDAWVATIPDTTEEHRKLVAELVEKGPAPEIDAKSKVVDMKSLKPTETFMLAFKLAFYAGLTLSFPFNLWFVLQFILPGLKQREKKVMWPALSVGFGLFLMGGCFSYFVVLPKALDFFFSFGTDMGVQNEWRIGEYISFVTQFTLIFGLAFELPVLVMTLVKLGLVNYKTMANTRAYAVLAIIVIAALITPTGDMLTLSMLAVPMYILYELCIILAYFDYRKEKRLEKEEEELSGVRQHPEISSSASLIAMDDGDTDPEDDDDPDPHGYDDEPDLADHDDEPDLEDHHDEPDSETHDDATAHYHGFEDHHDEDSYYDHDDEESDEYDEYAKFREPDHYHSEESDEEAVSESEGDEGDSDSYQDNLDQQEQEQDHSEVEAEEEDETDYNPGATFEQQHGVDETTQGQSDETSVDPADADDLKLEEEPEKKKPTDLETDNDQA